MITWRAPYSANHLVCAPLPPPRVHHQFALKRVGAAKGIGHRVLEPVDLEIGEVEIVPLIAKGLNSFFVGTYSMKRGIPLMMG